MTMIADGQLPPVDFGLPPKYSEWRANQLDGIYRVMDAPTRFVTVCAPTGFGKSVLSMAAGLMSGARTVVLTSTKGLQDQLLEFSDISVDLRGMDNYLCPIAAQLGVSPSTTVNEAPCQCGYNCRLRFAGCKYFDIYRAAQSAGIVVTNYSCWFYDILRERDLTADKPVDMLILDEAHSAPDSLAKFIGVDLSRREVLTSHLHWPDSDMDVEEWALWGTESDETIVDRIKTLELRVKQGQGSSGGGAWSRELKDLRNLHRKLSRISGMQIDEEWIIEEQDGMKTVRFDPLWPARYAESALFRGVEKVVLVSATVRPKTAELLGIAPEDMEFVEYPSSFPKQRRPVIYVPSVMVNYRTEQDDVQMMWWLNKIDQIIEKRLDRKGIVHAVSYKRAKFIFDNSKFARHMIMHDSRGRADAVSQYRRADAPAILISPSVTTGYDFSGDECRFQIICKIPFPSTQDKVIKARQTHDREYSMYLTAQTIVQTTGRSTRSIEDWSEVFIVDDSIKWAFQKMRKFLPKWWIESYKSVANVPEPLTFTDVVPISTGQS